MNGKKFIVTGGAGFIGSHIVDALIARGDDVVVVDDLSSGLKENINPKARFHKIDICDRSAFTDLVLREKPAGVFHLAAIVSVQFSIEHPEQTFNVNVTGTKNVYEAAHTCGAKVIFSSSSAVYGDQIGEAGNAEIEPVYESSLLAPKSPYGEHKKLGEIYADLSLRYFNVYGPRQRGDSPYAGVVAQFIARKKAGKPLTIFGDGLQTRDFVSVHDVVRANLMAMDKTLSGTISGGEAINIGSGVASTILDIAKIVGGEIQYALARIEPRHSLANISKAERLIEWSPSVSLKDGIVELMMMN